MPSLTACLEVMRTLELVKSRKTKEPAKKLTKKIIEEARRNGLLLIKAGYYSNVINVIRLHSHSLYPKRTS